MIPVIVVSHGGISRELVAIARVILGPQAALDSVEIDRAASVENLREKISGMVEGYSEAEDYGGTLVLADMLGGSSCNICVPLVNKHKICIVSGVNLYMLLSALQNRQTLSLEELKERAMADGARSIADVCRVFKK